MRAYLDHNATTPLRAEARAAMTEAMDVTGNPSSVHAEGRAAKALIEQARAQVAALVDAGDADVVFVSGASEAAALAFAGRRVAGTTVEHDCVRSWVLAEDNIAVDDQGLVDLDQLKGPAHGADIVAVQAANSETGILQSVNKVAGALDGTVPRPLLVTDAVQIAGKLAWSFERSRADMALLSAHKLGGPKGVGALILRRGIELPAQIRGGGQEMGRRAGTENVIGIAGFGAAASAAAKDVADGRWDEVAHLRDLLEAALADGERHTILVGKESQRLPNTSCIIARGWKGETQVMQMDLSRFAVSAGSACSSGKVRASTVLGAMGHDNTAAACAIRVSLGLDTTQDDILRFAETWLAKRSKHEMRAA